MTRPIFDDDEPLFDYGSIDELSALGMGDRGYADVNPRYGSNDLFEDQFERRAREIQRVPSGIQPVYIIPQRSGPWSANNQFGIEQGFAPDANNNQTILKLPEWGFPQVWSVMLGATIPSLNTASYQIIASIEAGVGGITDTFEVDWNAGIAFSVVTNALNITARYGNSAVIPTDTRLRVMVGRRPLPGSAPTRTFNDAVADTVTDQFVIPKYAKSVTLVPGFAIAPNTGDVFNALMTYQFATASAAGIITELTGQQILTLGNGGSVPIPGGANFFNVTNNTGFTVIYGLVFHLGL